MFIEIELDKIRSFKMTMAAQKRIESHFKKPFAGIDQENLFVDDYVIMLHACLKKDDRDELNKNQLFEILDENLNCKEVYELFTKIIMEGFGIEKDDPKPPEEEQEQEEQSGIGVEPYETLS